jgi:hypothetical protein
MARLARLEVPRGWYHVIKRGHQRRAIFRDRRCYEDFLTRLGQFPERFGVRKLSLGARGGLAAAMHWLNTGYGIWFNRLYRRQGALFQGRYKAILFDPDECLLAIHYYIHLNPVRVGALKAAEIEEGRRQELRDRKLQRGCHVGWSLAAATSSQTATPKIASRYRPTSECSMLRYVPISGYSPATQVVESRPAF